MDYDYTENVVLDVKGDNGNVAILTVAIVVLTATLICTLCLVARWCRMWCLRMARRDSDETIILDMPKRKPSVKIKEKISPLYQSVGVQLDIHQGGDDEGVIPAEVARVSLPPTAGPTLSLRLHFSPQCDATSLGRLHVQVEGGCNLGGRDYAQLPNYCVQLSVVQRRWTLSSEEKQLHHARTRVIPSSCNPLYHQLFTFAANPADLKVWCLRVGVWDEDRHTRSREVYHGRISLKEVKEIMDEGGVPLAIGLEPTISELGQVLVSLNYLPTAQRLSVALLRSDSLPWSNVCSSLDDFRGAARVILVDERGRVVKKKRLTANSGVDCPSFVGTALFVAPPILLETATVLIQIYHLDRSGESEDMEEDKSNKTNVLGFAAVGLMVHDEAARCQWQSLLQHPRKVITQWHSLR